MEALLVMFKADGTRLDFRIKPDRRYIIGRKDTCDLRIPLSAVSREHAAVYFEEQDEELIIEDLGSSNGTFVNNEKVDRLDLCPGDLVTVGPIPFQVVIDGHPREINPPKPADGADSVTMHSNGDDLDDDDLLAASPETIAMSPKTAKVSEEAGDEILDISGDDAGPDDAVAMPDESDSFFAFDLEEDED